MALKWLRDQMKYLTWVLWIIVAAFIFALFFDFGAADLSRSQNQIAATVGDEKITYEEFRRQYQNLESRYRQMFGEQWNTEMAERFNLPKQALDQLIDRRIRLMEAKRVGLQVTDQEVTDAILDFPAFQDEDGNFIGREQVQKLLRANRISDAQFAEDLREDLLNQKLSRVLASTLYVSDEEVQEAYKETVETADFQYVQLAASSLNDVAATDEELQAYFAENGAKYEIPEQRIVDYILIDTFKLRQELEISDEELRQYYDDNQEDFTQPEQIMARHVLIRGDNRSDAEAQAKVAEAQARLNGGEDFSVVARELSEDPGSAEQGGNLGFFARGKMVREFEDAAFGAEVGQLVGPVKTQFGYHLIEVMQRREGGVQDFNLVKAGIKTRLLNPRVEEMAEDKAGEVIAKIKEGSLETSEQLKALAEELGLTFESTEPFDRRTPVVGIGSPAPFYDAVYELEEGEITEEAIKIGRGWVVSRLTGINAPRIPELSEVEDKVRRDTEEEKRKDEAVIRLADAKSQLADGSDFQTLADNLGLEVQTSGPVGASGTVTGLGNARSVLDAALDMEVGEISDPIQTDQGAVLFEVLDRVKFDVAEFEEQKEATRSGEVNRRLSQMLASIVEKRRRDLAPEYDKRVVADFGIQNEG